MKNAKKILVIDDDLEFTDAVKGLLKLAKYDVAIASDAKEGKEKFLSEGPDLILLDEPTCGMSPTETTSTIELIRRISEDKSVTVLFTEHKMDVVFSVSSHITVMNFGLVIASGGPEEIRQNQRVRDVYLGEA